MKRTIVLFSALLLMFSCSKKDISTKNPDNMAGINRDKMISFADAGRLHNEALSTIVSRLKSDGNENYLSLENKARSIALDYVGANNPLLSKADIEFGYRLRPSIFVYERFTRKTISSYAAGTLAKLESAKAIKHDEAEFIASVFTVLQGIADGKSGLNPVEAMDNLSKTWEAKHYRTDRGEGILSGYCVSIGKASAELWMNSDLGKTGKGITTGVSKVVTHSDDDIPRDMILDDYPPIIFDPNDPDGPSIIFDPSEVITPSAAHIIAADIAGALGGAAGSILDNLWNGNPVNWKSAGAWAVGGAIGASSVGGIYRLIKWLF